MFRATLFLCFTFSALSMASATDPPLKIVTWNVESGGADATEIANRMGKIKGVDLWGLCEVKDKDTALKFSVAAATGADISGRFEYELGSTGGVDCLAVIYNPNRLEKIDLIELDEMNIGGKVRAPLVVHFKEKTTNKEFLFMVNHLYRGNATARHQQARMLNEWAKIYGPSFPTIAVGDYGFAYHYNNGSTDHDKGLDLMQEDGMWTWLEPRRKIPTENSPHKDISDFVFVTGDATTWERKSEILLQPGDFPDNGNTSNHRPVEATFTFTSATASAPAATSDEVKELAEKLRAKYAELETKLNELKQLIPPEEAPPGM